MGFLNSLYYRTEFFFLGHVNRVFQIHTGNRLVGRDLNNVHSVNIPELFLLGESRTGHTGFLLIFIKEVLEGDRCQSLAFPAYLYMLFCLDSLMKTIGIPAAWHDTPCELIYDQNFIIFYHIVLIPEHKIVGSEGQVDIVLDLQIFRIRQVVNMEEFLHLMNSLLCQVYDLVLLIDDKVSGLGDLLAHNSGHLRDLAAGLASFQLSGKDIADFVKSGRLAALSGNDQRGTGFIDKHRVHLIDDGIVQISLYQLFLVDHHVVTKIVKSQFIVGHIGDVTGILSSSLIIFHRVKDHTYSKSQELMDFSHPFCVTVCQVIIDGYNVHALSFQGIQIGRKSRHQSLSFTGLHLCDTALVKNDTADQLYPVMFHAKDTLRGLPDSGKCFRQKIIQGFSFLKTVFIFSSLSSKLIIA